MLFASVASAQEAAVCSGEADTCRVPAEGSEIEGMTDDTTLMQRQLLKNTGAVKSAEQDVRSGPDGQFLQDEGFRAEGNETQMTKAWLHEILQDEDLRAEGNETWFGSQQPPWDKRKANSVKNKVLAAVRGIRKHAFGLLAKPAIFHDKTGVLTQMACTMEKAYVRSVGGSVGAVFGVEGSVDVGCGYIKDVGDYKIIKCATFISVCASGGIDGGADFGISWAEMDDYGSIAGFAAEVGVDICFGVCGGMSTIFCQQSDYSFKHCGAGIAVGLGLKFSVSGSVCYTMQLPDWLRPEQTFWKKKADCVRHKSWADRNQESFKSFKRLHKGDEDGQDGSMADYFQKKVGGKAGGNRGNAADFYR